MAIGMGTQACQCWGTARSRTRFMSTAAAKKPAQSAKQFLGKMLGP